MTTKQVASVVDEAIALDRQIANLETELTEKKKLLIEEARRELALLLREEVSGARGQVSGEPRPACTWSFHGSDGAEGSVATVTFPKDKLISGFFFLKPQENAFRMKDGKIAEVGPIRDLAGDAFGKLFSIQYKPAKAFRELCTAILPKRDAGRLIELCEEPCSPRVSFETKDSVKS